MVIWSALVIAVVVLVWGLLRLPAALAIAAGYKAKVLATAVFGSGRTMDPRHDDQISADAYWPLRFVRASIDDQARTVTASALALLKRTAVYREGCGATLQDGKTAPVLLQQSPGVFDGASSDGWREASGSAALARVVEAAFEEPNPARLRRTQAVIVIQDGRVVAERYAAGITADMPLPGWSMTKSIMSALIGTLVSEGRLAIDQRELLPQWRSPDPRSAISLEDLLRMRSGLRFSEAYSNPWSDVVQMLYNCGDTAAYAASRPLTAPPGQVWQYATGTTNILSLIGRRIVGDERYWSWPTRVLFARLGMRSAVLEPDASGTFVCSSYMLATARDWARYGQLWLNRGRWQNQEILSDEWVRFSTTPTPQSPEDRYGAHWWLKLNPDIGGDSADARAISADTFFAVGHEGQTLTVMPSKRAVIVRMGASIYIDAWNQATFAARIQDALP